MRRRGSRGKVVAGNGTAAVEPLRALARDQLAVASAMVPPIEFNVSRAERRRILDPVDEVESALAVRVTELAQIVPEKIVDISNDFFTKCLLNFRKSSTLKEPQAIELS